MKPIKIGANIVLYDCNDIALFFRVNPLTIKNYIKSGRLSGNKVGHRWYVTEESIRRLFIRRASEIRANVD